ncbi:MAG: DRTGG domain-containing protein [Eubacteriales bacterium]|jgi:predicted transcriptional regulator|nr:DRTGG domain-containing protein [Eubacteriales bacterium]
MKVSELARHLDLKPVTQANDREIRGCYISDLLSRVMTRANEGDIWITVHTNVNIVAVATLTEVSCIILAEGAEADKDTIEKANEKGVAILSTDLDSYSLGVAISKLI